MLFKPGLWASKFFVIAGLILAAGFYVGQRSLIGQAGRAELVGLVRKIGTVPTRKYILFKLSDDQSFRAMAASRLPLHVYEPLGPVYATKARDVMFVMAKSPQGQVELLTFNEGGLVSVERVNQINSSFIKLPDGELQLNQRPEQMADFDQPIEVL